MSDFAETVHEIYQRWCQCDPEKARLLRAGISLIIEGADEAHNLPLFGRGHLAQGVEDVVRKVAIGVSSEQTSSDEDFNF